MALKFDFLTVDAHDPKALAMFWQEALTDYEILEEPEQDPDDFDDSEEEVVLLPKSKRGAKMLFIKVPDSKEVKNRLHLDLRPEEVEMSVEVERLEALGAKKVDIGQGDVSWTVMADPEGNEFCILRRLTDDEETKYADWAW